LILSVECGALVPPALVCYIPAGCHQGILYPLLVERHLFRQAASVIPKWGVVVWFPSEKIWHVGHLLVGKNEAEPALKAGKATEYGGLWFSETKWGKNEVVI